MRTPPTASLSTAGRTLLLALALCACGGGDDPDRSADPGKPGATVAVQDSAACTPPPTIDTTFFQRTWAELSAHVRERGGRFPFTELNSDTRTVRLCDSCATAELTIHADAATHCTTPEQMDGQTRVMGIFVLARDFPGDPKNGWGPIARGDSIYAFASDTFADATLAYRDSEGRVARARDGFWAFYYCKHDRIPPGDRLAQWRDRGPPPTTQREDDRGKAKGKDDEEETGSYGWMACASGCCQFYTPPPNQSNDDDDDDDDDDGRGGRGTGDQRQVDPGPIPYWCHRTH